MKKTNMLYEYGEHLLSDERCSATREKYMRDIKAFYVWLGHSGIPSRDDLLRYKEFCLSRYRHSSVNSVIASLNGYFSFIGRSELRMKYVKLQHSAYREKEREMSEYS